MEPNTIEKIGDERGPIIEIILRIHNKITDDIYMYIKELVLNET